MTGLDFAWIAVAALLGGLCYRQRGGGFPFLSPGHTQLARLIWWAIPTGTLVALLLPEDTGGPWETAIVTVMADLGLVVIGNSQWQGIANGRQVLLASAVGTLRIALIVSPLVLWPWPLHLSAWCFAPLGGLLWGPLCWLAKREPWHLPHFTGAELGEFLCGAATFASLTAAGLIVFHI